MLELINVRNGAVLNHRDGIENADSLTFKLEGLADPRARVLVNGAETERMDRHFSAPVTLTRRRNDITVSASDNSGDISRRITVLWDKKSFRRFNFFFDDCIFFLTEIARERPKSLFDHFFLKCLREIHRDCGAKFTLNLFFHDDHHGFELTSFPDNYRAEFMDNRDWLRLSFHSRSEFPDRPYQNTTEKALSGDYDLVRNEIIRFAGEEVFIQPCVIHWAITNPANLHVLHERGVRSLSGGYIGARTYIGENHPVEVSDIGYFWEQDVTHYLAARRIFYDRNSDICFYKGVFCANYVPLEQVESHMNELFAADPHNETLGLMTHEQYSYPDYCRYLPDHLERVALACRMAVAAGYHPVFFAEGMLGNPILPDK